MCFYFTHSFLNGSTFHLDGPIPQYVFICSALCTLIFPFYILGSGLSNLKSLLKYMCPVILFSVVFNLPKFFEYHLDEMEYFNVENNRYEYSVQNLKLIRQHQKNCKTHLKGKTHAHCKYIQFLIVSTFHCNLAVQFTFFTIYSPM